MRWDHARNTGRTRMWARTNMFIGMMIRFEVLARLGRSEQLIRELKDVYLQELRDGSGTLFENVQPFPASCPSMEKPVL